MSNTLNGFAPQQIQEYKRTCKECGKIWHSLLDREKQIESSQTANTCILCGEMCGNQSAFNQTSRNIDANSDTLDKLRRCPDCGSHNYFEDIISFTMPETRTHSTPKKQPPPIPNAEPNDK